MPAACSFVSYKDFGDHGHLEIHGWTKANDSTGMMALRDFVAGLSPSGGADVEVDACDASIGDFVWEDMNGDGDMQKFVTADNVTDWENVLAVRFYLTFRSQIEFYDSDYEITLNDVDYDDRYLRQIANVTVRLRNR